ncbi:MAG: hypothetical protein NC314_05480 [Roseburia sp.]|nr:hypothetical protein [Roseburia sp.]MCM1242273.1 hypothetical protein [Roseburia sp.]
MKKWCKAFAFILPILVLVGAVNWYVDSYAYLRVTYDEIAGEMIDGGRNVSGLEESNFNDRSLLLACLKKQKAPEMIVMGSSRVLTFEQDMFGADSFYNAGLSESTIYDLLAVTGILVQEDKLPETMLIGIDPWLFNSSHDNDRWQELRSYEEYMEGLLTDGAAEDENSGDENNGDGMTGRDNSKWLSLAYFRYNITCLPGRERFMVSYTTEHEGMQYIKHCDGSIAYQEELRTVDAESVIALTRQTMEEQVVYRMTDYKQIDEKSMQMLADLTEYLQKRGVEVILYLPPYSPMLYDYIRSAEQYQITLDVEEKVKELALAQGIALYGSYDPAGSGLEMTDLYDVYHVKTEKMMDTYFPVIEPDEKRMKNE